MAAGRLSADYADFLLGRGALHNLLDRLRLTGGLDPDKVSSPFPLYETYAVEPDDPVLAACGNR